jgi:glutamine amidotransferase
VSENVVIVDYGSGNLRSAAKAFERAAREGGKGATITVSADAKTVREADRVVLPGVGAFADCYNGLAAVPGMLEALDDVARKKARPFLGICVGMQLMADVGREHGEHKGLGWIKGEVVALTPTDPALKVPQIGWNNLSYGRFHSLFDGIAPGVHAYFVHSYHFACADVRDRIAMVDYGGTVTAAVHRGNLVGTQFHPEKSQAMGLKLIANFLRWRP